MPKAAITSEKKAALIMEALEEKKAVDPVLLNVRGRTVMTDCFIITSGTSRIHIQALVDAVVEKLKDNGVRSKRVEGYSEAAWVLLDYGDVVVHIMAQDQRDFYRLEAYWSGAEKGSPPVLEE
ncbi:MAG TPA: ribosome silencing factor [Armatimonadota bacterium]|nr:ribosome silencing factor [Armatimonadota bacterium]